MQINTASAQTEILAGELSIFGICTKVPYYDTVFLPLQTYTIDPCQCFVRMMSKLYAELRCPLIIVNDVIIYPGMDHLVHRFNFLVQPEYIVE